MNFGNVKGKKASLREMYLPSILAPPLIQYTFQILFPEKYNFQFYQKKKESPSDSHQNYFSLVCPLLPLRFNLQTRQENQPTRSNNLHETSQRLQPPNLKVATTPSIPLPFQFPKQSRNNRCSTTDHHETTSPPLLFPSRY